MLVIALFRTAGVGDVVLATVAIDLIREAEPEAEIHWFGRKPMLDLIKGYYPFVHVHEILSSASFTAHCQVINGASSRFDLIIDLQKSLRTFLLGNWMANKFHCPYYSWKKQSLRRSALVWQSRIRGRKTVLELFPSSLKNRSQAFTACVILALQKQGKGSALLSGRSIPKLPHNQIRTPKTIAICLGSSFSAKELPLYKTAELLRYILEQDLARKIYFLGDRNKHAEAEQLIASSGVPERFQNCCGQTSLPEAGDILATAAFSVGNDSGLAHLSESVGTPALVFFGPTDERFGYRMHLPLSKIFSVTLGCRPCTKDGNAVCRYKDYLCLHSIPLEPVFEHMLLLSKTG
ncbi:MAG TPA: glycosyltransferase family 9 protein [Bacteroidia bacterium]|jgi:ADP-heptose:LPS heptosyltransferase|nr:glycosyltransferase family 9 protein [Bacteroidia bacterium]